MKVQILETFKCWGQISPNSSCHFWKKRSVFLQILHQSSGSWDITPLDFSAKVLYTYFKEPIIKVQIWWNFTWTVQSLKFCTLMGSFCPNHVVSAKKCTEELSLMTLKSDPKFKEKLTFCLKNDVKNSMNFNSSSEKSENLHFDGVFLSKVCNVWVKIIQTSCAVKNDLWFKNDMKKFREFSQN